MSIEVKEVGGLPRWLRGKATAQQFRRHRRREFRSLGQEDSLEEVMASNFSILALEIPWTEEPGGPQSMGSQRV